MPPQTQDSPRGARGGRGGRARGRGRGRGRGGHGRGGSQANTTENTTTAPAPAATATPEENPNQNQRGQRNCRNGRRSSRGRGKTSQPQAMMPQSESRQNQQAGAAQKAPTEKKKKNRKKKAAPTPSDVANPTKDKTPNKKENKPTPPPKKTKPSLTTLPAEIRWKIYNYIFQPTYRVAITHQKPKWTPSPTDTRKRLYHTRLPYRNPKTQMSPHDSKHSQVVRRRNPLPISLIFSCKVIYRETILHLYANTQFVFNSTRALDRFLHTTSSQAQEVIQHIELNHIMYNEPRLLGFRVFKHRSDLAWYCACEDLAVACKSLRALHISMKIWDWPIHLELGERWSWPLLVFERFGNKVDFASVTLQMCKFEEERLKEMSREVEKRLMRSEAWQVREDERMAREINGKVKANRVLRVVF